MKQAICLLCCGKLNYITSFLHQFENHPDINIYIHYHKKYETNEYKECVVQFLSRMHNVRCVMTDYETFRFSADMVRAEMALYEYALQDDEDNVVFHLMGESDYLICPPQYFVDYFNRYKDFDFVTYVHDQRLAKSGPNFMLNQLSMHFPDNALCFVKACQQKSLSRSTATRLIGLKDAIEMLLSSNQDFRGTIPGALDEFVVPTVIYSLIGDKSIGAKRYVNWSAKHTGHPNTLRLSDYTNDVHRKEYAYIDYIILGNFIIRKIDVCSPDSLAFLKYFQNKFKEIEQKQRKINDI